MMPPVLLKGSLKYLIKGRSQRAAPFSVFAYDSVPKFVPKLRRPFLGVAEDCGTSSR